MGFLNFLRGQHLNADRSNDYNTAALSAIQDIYHATTRGDRRLLADGILTLGDRAVVAGGWTIERVSDADYNGVVFKRGEVVHELEATEVNHLYHLLLT